MSFFLSRHSDVALLNSKVFLLHIRQVVLSTLFTNKKQLAYVCHSCIHQGCINCSCVEPYCFLWALELQQYCFHLYNTKASWWSWWWWENRKHKEKKENKKKSLYYYSIKDDSMRVCDSLSNGTFLNISLLRAEHTIAINENDVTFFPFYVYLNVVLLASRDF